MWGMLLAAQSTHFQTERSQALDVLSDGATLTALKRVINALTER